MNWSDDESTNIIANQPSRDMPSTESDEDDTNYMQEIINKTKNKNYDLPLYTKKQDECERIKNKQKIP